MALHKKIAFEADMELFFCDPRSPWQRGSNENANGLLRQYFPRSVSLRQFTPEDLDEVAASSTAAPARPSIGPHPHNDSKSYLNAQRLLGGDCSVAATDLITAA